MDCLLLTLSQPNKKWADIPMNKHLLHPLLLLVLVSCAAAPPKYSQSDVSSANSREQQLALYQSLANELAVDGTSSNAAGYRQLMTGLGNTMGKEESQQISDRVASSKLASGHVPLSVLNEAEADAEPIQSWSPGQYNSLIDELRQSRLATEAALENDQALLKTLTAESQLVQRVEVLRRSRDLYGDNLDAEMAYKVAFEDGQTTLKAAGDQALVNGEYEKALYHYESLKQLDPEFPRIDQLIASSGTGMEASDFQQLLLDGDIEAAWSTFVSLSNKPMTPSQKNEFLRPAASLADYLASYAANMISAGQYQQAYVTINREMEIRTWLNQSSQISTSSIFEFTEAMFDLSVASASRDKFGLEYGYLLLVEEFDPAYSSLETLKREAAEAVYENAIRRVGSVSLVSADRSDQQIAAQVAAGVNQYLMENIPEDVKIVERDKLDDIRRERGMNDETGEPGSDVTELESADFLIEGELLTAEVAPEVKQLKNTERVVTGQKEVPNPAFDAWIKEKGKRKADHPDAPPRTIMQPVKEDITINIEEHQKDGVVGVTYRIIDTKSAEHVHIKSVSKDMRVRDQARQGIRLGDYVQEAKMAELPSDNEIYNTLVDEVVDEMAKDLVSFLANPDGDYFANCKQLALESRNEEAAEYCANAAVLREFKTQDNTEIVSMLKLVTLDSGMRSD